VPAHKLAATMGQMARREKVKVTYVNPVNCWVYITNVHHTRRPKKLSEGATFMKAIGHQRPPVQTDPAPSTSQWWVSPLAPRSPADHM